MKEVLGIDPGLSGALALYEPVGGSLRALRAAMEVEAIESVRSEFDHAVRHQRTQPVNEEGSAR